MRPVDFPSVIPTRILVPIDFSLSSHASLDAAAELAEKFHSELYLLNVIPAFPNVSLPDSITEAAVIEQARQVSNERFDLSTKSISARGITVKTSVEVNNDVIGALLETIEREKVDFIVITTHGLSGWYPNVFGSITEKLLKLAPCPILLLRTPKAETDAKIPFAHAIEWW